mgnify:FL=1
MAQLLDDVLVWQANFQGRDLVAYMKFHTEIPIFIVCFYLGLVFHGPVVMRSRPPMQLKAAFTLWNLLLSVFSIIGCYYTAPVFLRSVFGKGFYFSVCADPSDFYFDGASGFWVGLFILSKIPELVDTFFLVAQKKDVIFLHWFHHCTVMLYCWHAYTHKIGAGLWFASMNYFVHSLMYTYYFMQNVSFLKNFARRFARIITTLQLVQMVFGLIVTISVVVYLNQGVPCAANPANSKLGLGMYLSYFVLFAALYKRLYGKGGRKAAIGSAGHGGSGGAGHSGSASDASAGGEGICNAADDVMATLNTGNGKKLK